MAMMLSREIDAHVHEIPAWCEWEMAHGKKASEGSWVSFGGGENYIPLDKVEEERRAAEQTQRAGAEARAKLEAELRQKDAQVQELRSEVENIKAELQRVRQKSPRTVKRA